MRYVGPGSSPDHSIQTDASGTWGCGAFFEGRWLQFTWPPVWIPCNIMAKELVPIILSCTVWGPYLTRRCVLFQCDNYILVVAINKGSAKDPFVMHLLRCLWLFVALYDIDIVAEHITTDQQLTRWRTCYLEIKVISFFPNTHRGIQISHPITTISAPPSVSSQAKLDIPKLQGVLQRYYLSGIASTTRNTYAAGQKQYKIFCSLANRTPMLTSETTLLLFVAHLTTLNLFHTTIKVYLSAVQYMHVTVGQHSIFTQQLTPRLQ